MRIPLHLAWIVRKKKKKKKAVLKVENNYNKIQEISEM